MGRVFQDNADMALHQLAEKVHFLRMATLDHSAHNTRLYSRDNRLLLAIYASHICYCFPSFEAINLFKIYLQEYQQALGKE